MPLPKMPSRPEEPENVEPVRSPLPAMPTISQTPSPAPTPAPSTKPASFLPTSIPFFDNDEPLEDPDALELPSSFNSIEETPEPDPFEVDETEVIHAKIDNNIFDEEVPETALDTAVQSLSPAVQDSVERLLMHINDQQSSEVLMNGPKEIMIKVNGARFHVSSIDFEDIETYHYVINNFLLPFVDTLDRINDSSYLIEGQMELPDMEDPEQPPTIARVHIMAPPAVKVAKVTIAKKARKQYTIDDIVSSGSMTPKMGEFLKIAAKGKLTIVLSGLSGSGKTTLLEAMSHHFDQDDRVIVVEDTQELMLPISDVVCMRSQLARPGESDKDPVTLEWLVSQANRMRPDRIIIGEVRGGEMSEFLVAANSGADGSMTTIHAGNPKLTLAKIASLAMKNTTSKNEDSIIRDIASTIQIIVQASLIDGQHIITHIEEVSDIVNQNTKSIATQTIYEYDRNTGVHKAISHPSEKIKSFLGQRGIKLDPQLFTNR